MAGWKKALIECLEWEWHSDRLVVAGCTHWDFKPERQLYDG